MRGAQNKAAEEALRESEELFRATFENAAVGMAHVSPDGRFFHVNRRLCEILGYGASELCKKTVKEISHPADAEVSKPRLQQMASGSIDSFTLEKRYLRKDQTIVWAKIAVGCLRKADKTVDYHITVVEDISERKAAETALRESEQRFRALGQASVNALYRMNADASVMLEANGQGFMTDTPHPTQSWLATYVPPNEQGTVLEAVGLAVATLTPFDLEHRVYLADGTTGWIRNRAVPILEEGGAVREWFGSASDITDRKRAEEALRVSEARLRLSLDAAELGTWHWDIAKGPGAAEADARAKALFGLSLDDPVSCEIWAKALLPEDRGEAEASFGRAIDPADPRDDYACEYRVRHADGKVLSLSTTGRAYFEADPAAPSGRKVVSMAGTVRDVTEVRQADAILESERQLRHLGDRLPDSAVYQFVRSPDGTAHCRYVSAGIEKLIGVRVEDLLRDASVIDKMMLPDHVQRVIDAERSSARNLSDFKVEAPLRCINGEVRWIRFQSRPQRLPDRSIMWEGFATDVTGRKRAEEALRESEEQLRLFVEQAPVSIAMFDHDMRYLASSRRWNAEHGVPEANLVGQTHYKAFPEIPERWRIAHRRGLAGETVREEEDLLVRLDGRSQWFRWEIRPWLKADHGIGGILIFSEDVTARVETERALRQSEERFRGIFEHAGTGIAIMDLEGRFQSCNPAYSAMLGYSEEELRALLFQDLVHPEDRAANIAENRRLLGQEIPAFEIVNRYVRKDGKSIWVHKYISLLRDHSGTPTGLIALVTDMTERRRQEEQIRLLMREVNHRSKNMLALVQAVARQTRASNPDDFLERFGERIQALAGAQDLLIKNEWRGVDLEELVLSQLAHFKDLIGTRIKLKGHALLISASAAQTIGMALHELATNAGKYGALSTREGRVEIEWSHKRAGTDKETFELTWREKGGPAVEPPSVQGFGSTVICTLAEANLNAMVELDFAAGGLSWRLQCPAANVEEVCSEPVFEVTKPVRGNVPASAHPRVLVVEDEALIALEIAHVLSDAGFDVIGPARAVAAALSLIEESGCDVAVLDVNLGGETSEPVAWRLLAKGTPFVTLSGYSRAQHPPVFSSAPVLAKPLQPELLITEVRGCLGHAAQTIVKRPARC